MRESAPARSGQAAQWLFRFLRQWSSKEYIFGRCRAEVVASEEGGLATGSRECLAGGLRFATVLDMFMATDAPIGFGHVYAPAHYVDAWIEVTDVRDWSAEQIARLKRHLSKP